MLISHSDYYRREQSKDMTPSDFTAVAGADEEGTGSPALSIEPKVTAEPLQTRHLQSDEGLRGHAYLVLPSPLYSVVH